MYHSGKGRDGGKGDGKGLTVTNGTAGDLVMLDRVPERLLRTWAALSV